MIVKTGSPKNKEQYDVQKEKINVKFLNLHQSYPFLLSPTSSALRVVFHQPGRSDAFSADEFGWLRLGSDAGVHVYSRSSCSVWFWLYAGSRRHAWRKVPALSGQIRYWPVVLLLAAALLWVEQEATGISASGYSENKACSGGDSGSSTGTMSSSSWLPR